MSVMERKKEKEQKEKIEEDEELDKELMELKAELESMTKKKETTLTHAPEKIRVEEREREVTFPEWVEKAPWMYVKPKNPYHVESWLEEWSKLLLDYAKQKELFGIDVNELAESYPFAKLSLENLKEILDFAVKKGLAEWADEDKKFIKLRWRTIPGWARKLYQMGIKEGYPRYDMFQLIDTFGMFPEDVRAIFDYMVKNGLAKYLGKTKKVIELIV